MSREILFKAKRKDNGEWIEGYILRDDVTGQYFIHASGNSVNESDKVNEEGCLHFVAFEIDKDTICQYTGLTDKNGNKIWENDVVKCYADTDDLGNDLYFFYKVIWHENYHCWWLSDIHTQEDEYLHQYNPSDIEVIGNAFDNPELIGGAMAKAILVMDMPSCCDKCDIKGIFCGDVGDNDMCRAGGCPLKEVPEKQEDLPTNIYREGWNACIDKILRGSGKNE